MQSVCHVTRFWPIPFAHILPLAMTLLYRHRLLSSIQIALIFRGGSSPFILGEAVADQRSPELRAVTRKISSVICSSKQSLRQNQHIISIFFIQDAPVNSIKMSFGGQSCDWGGWPPPTWNRPCYKYRYFTRPLQEKRLHCCKIQKMHTRIIYCISPMSVCPIFQCCIFYPWCMMKWSQRRICHPTINGLIPGRSAAAGKVTVGLTSRWSSDFTLSTYTGSRFKKGSEWTSMTVGCSS